MNFQEILSGWSVCQGWCSQQKASTLALLVFAARPKLSVEIGVFGGKGIIPVAIAHRQLGTGKAIGIDPWRAVESVAGQNDADSKWWSDQSMHDKIFEGFMSARSQFGLNSCLDVYRCPSNDFDPEDGIGILIIDGNHGPQAVTDVERFAPHVSHGGFVVMDDLDWSGGAVREAEKRLLAIGFKQVFSVLESGGSWGVYQRL